MDHAARGAQALAASNPTTAIVAYTQALIQHPTSPDYYIQRSTAFTRLRAPQGPRQDLALQDAEYAVLCGQKRANRSKIQAGQQRRVVTLLNLGRVGDAGFLLQTMEKWRKKSDPKDRTDSNGGNKDKMEGDMWKAKIEQRKKALAADDEKLAVTVGEYPDQRLPSDSELIRMLRKQLKGDGAFNFDGEEEPTQPASTTNNAISSSSASKDTEMTGVGARLTTGEVPVSDIKMDTSGSKSMSTASAPVLEPVTLTKIRNDWIQSAQSVTVTLYAKGVQKDQAQMDIQEDSIMVSFPHPSDPHKDFVYTLDPLFAFIDPAASKASVMSTKIEFVLHKRVAGQKWPSLEGLAPLKNAEPGPETSAAKAAVMSTYSERPASTPTATAPSYPTSSKGGPKNWDKLANDLTAKKKKGKGKKRGKENDSAASDDDESGIDSDYDTGDAVDGFFKKLYANSDDNTKRAMMKSMQESNGTSLSTNWSEVGKGKVEPYKSKDDD